jgi:15-cis-phytoene synthase
MQPRSSDLAPTARSDLKACRALLRDGSKSFFLASFLLPHPVRSSATALYAFCRVADDAIDCAGRQPGAIETLYRRLDQAYAGAPWPVPSDRAFMRVAVTHQIPRDIPEALIEGLAWDADGRRYETIDDLTAYAVRVAGTVGLMFALVMGVRSPQLLARACDLGIAMQLTNIARDVGEDAASGRIYLPLSWMRNAGIDPDAWLASPRASPALASVIDKLLATADDFYRRADAGIAGLPARCRPGVHAARLIYSEIGREVARNGHDSVTRRAVVSKERKLALLAEAMLPPQNARSLRDLPPAPAAKLLIEAASKAGSGETPHPGDAPAAWWDLAGQGVRLIEIFERLEKRERAAL